MPTSRKKAAKRAAKRAKRLQKSISLVRAQRRALFAQQPLHIRMAAAELLPKSRRQVGKKLGHHRREVVRIRALLAKAPDPQTRQALARELSDNIKEMAGLIAVARKKRDRARRGGMAGVEKVGPAQARTRLASVRKQLASVNADFKKHVKAMKAKKGPPAVRQNRKLQIQILSSRRVHLKRRQALLKRGLDFQRPVRLHPAKVPIQRKLLTLPRAWAVPKSADVTVLIRLLATLVPRRPGESDRRYMQRLRAYTQRSLLRLINLRSSNVTGPTAIRQAAEATIEVDGPALDAEAEAGGVVIDPTAESMDDIIQPVADQLEAATEDLQAQVPAGEPSEEEIDRLVAVAEEEEADAAMAPIEAEDELEEDLLAAEEPFAPDFDELDEEILDEDMEDLEDEGEEDEGINPMLVAGVIGGLGLLWFLSGR